MCVPDRGLPLLHDRPLALFDALFVLSLGSVALLLLVLNILSKRLNEKPPPPRRLAGLEEKCPEQQKQDENIEKLDQ
jgi:hypothetical protein